MAVDKQAVFQELKELIGEELKVISFKWLARHFSIPADAAKRLLFEFTEGHKDKISATYLISGWTKASQPQHTVELVDAKALAQRRSKLDPVTSLHVYSVQPVQPRDVSDLWNTDHLQTAELFASMVKEGQSNCLADNRWSAVKCQGAQRDPSLAVSAAAAKRAQKPAVDAPPAKPAANSVVAAIKAAAAGKAAVATGKAGGADSAPAVRKDKQSDIKESGRQPSVKENAAPAGAGSASAPAAAPSRGSGKPGTTAAAAGKKKGGLSDMWSRAPPKKAAAPASKGAAQPQKAAATPAVDAEAALKLNNEAESSGSESDEDAAPIQRAKARRRAHVIGEEESPVKQPAAKRQRAGDAAEQPAAPELAVPKRLTEPSDDDSDWDIPRHRAAAAAAGKRSKGVAGQAGKDQEVPRNDAAAAAEGKEDPVADEAAAETATDKKKGARKGSAGQKRPAPPLVPGIVKVHGSALGGPTRRKVQRTTYNDKGEEITEMVYEEDPADMAKADQEVKEEKGGTEAPAAQPKAPAAAPAKKATRATSQSQDSGAAAATAKKAAAAEGTKGGAKKAAGKVKAAGAGQRGIMSFFAKKPS